VTDLTEQRFIYAGKRLTVDKKLVSCWIPEDGVWDESNVRLFPKAKAGAIGGIYTIKVSEDSYLPSSVTYTGEGVDRDIRAQLEARDRADGSQHALNTLERNAARKSELKDMCAPLRELVGKQVGWASRAALLSYITSEISRG
jgi:hypothetical protein